MKLVSFREPAANQQKETNLPRLHSASAPQLSIVSLQGQLMFLLSHFLLFYPLCCFTKIDPRDCVQCQSGKYAMLLQSLAGVQHLASALSH